MKPRNITFKAKWIKILSTVPAVIRAQYVSAIYEYILNGTEPKDMQMQVGFAFFKDEIDRANCARARREESLKKTVKSSDEADNNSSQIAEHAPIQTLEQAPAQAHVSSCAVVPTGHHKLAYLEKPRIQTLMKEKRERCDGCQYMYSPVRCERVGCPKYKATDAEAVCAIYADGG